MSKIKSLAIFILLPVIAFCYEPKAKQISNAPAGNIMATSVQDAINELDTEKSPIAHNHNLNDLQEKSYNSLTDKPAIPAVEDVAKGVTAYNWGDHALEGYIKGNGNTTTTALIPFSEGLSVATNKKIGLDGPSGNTYFIYNGTEVLLYINGNLTHIWRD